MKTLPVTLVIPHRNRADEIRRCLRSLREAKTIPQEILVVDDCSQAKQLQLLRNVLSEFKNLNVTLFCYSEHMGTSDAKNLGISETQTPYIWFLDSDTEIINPNALEIGCQLLDKNSDIGVVGAEIVEDYNCQRYVREAYLLKSLWTAYIHHPGGNDIRKEVDVIATNNFLTRTNLMEEIGGFHSKIVDGEDKLACLQIRELGYSIFLDSRCGVLHHRTFTERAQFLTRVRIHFRDAAFIYGATSNFWKVAAFHINCMFSLWKHYKNRMEMYQIFVHHQDTLKTNQNRISKLVDMGKLMVQYILANKTYMSVKGYCFRLKGRIIKHSKRSTYEL